MREREPQMSNRGSCRRLWTVLYWAEAGSAESSTLPIPVHLWYGVQPLYRTRVASADLHWNWERSIAILGGGKRLTKKGGLAIA